MKEKYTVRMDKELVEKVDDVFSKHRFKSRSEFIENATSFYLNYLIPKNMENYLGQAIHDLVKQAVGETMNKVSSNMFRFTLEQAMIMNVLATSLEIEHSQLRALRARCIREITETKGKYTFKEAYDYQHSDDLEEDYD